MSRQGNKKESASGMDLLKSVDIVSNHLTWTPEGMDHPILKDITLTLEPGHIYGIIGPNGAGKSSFLRHVLAFLKTESKESMKIGDVPADDYPRKKLARLLSFVPQKTDIETDFTAEEIVMTGRTPYQGRFEGTSIGDKEAVYRAFSLTKADKLKNKKFAILSGGEKQKIVIARAVAQTTPWMLLDEPITSLDIKNQIEIMQTLSELNRQEGVSVLMVLHDINLSARYADYIFAMYQGQLEAQGAPLKIITPGLIKKIYGLDCQIIPDPVSRTPLVIPEGRHHKTIQP